jgi:hypothetical protein
MIESYEMGTPPRENRVKNNSSQENSENFQLPGADRDTLSRSVLSGDSSFPRTKISSSPVRNGAVAARHVVMYAAEVVYVQCT